MTSLIKSGVPLGTRPEWHFPKLIGTNEEPWMVRESINFIYEQISKLESRKLLEYGSGSSSIWFLKMLNCEVTSIEHDSDWYKKVEEKIPNEYKNKWKGILKLNQIEGFDEGSGTDDEFYYDEYVKTIDELEEFDIIVIDGRCRSKCILKSISKLKSKGIFIVDNAERLTYRKAINKIPKEWKKYIFSNHIDTTIVWKKE